MFSLFLLERYFDASPSVFSSSKAEDLAEDENEDNEGKEGFLLLYQEISVRDVNRIVFVHRRNLSDVFGVEYFPN